MRDPAESTVQIFEQAPRPDLRRFVLRFMVVEFPALHNDAHLPDTGPVAAFTFRGKVRIGGEWVPPAAFTGPRETLTAHEHHPGHAVLLATFTPAGANAFLRPSLEEFTAINADLTGVLGCRNELDQLHELLAEAPDHRRRVTLLENFLLARIRLPAPDPLVAAAVAWLEGKNGAGRIDQLTRYVGLSQSALERRFRRVVGISPKRFASVVRLRHAVQLRAAGVSSSILAHTAGYFDQAHFINDFRRATGSTPDVFFRSML
jgi:AraC-like DNA-binding protein